MYQKEAITENILIFFLYELCSSFIEKTCYQPIFFLNDIIYLFFNKNMPIFIYFSGQIMLNYVLEIIK